MLVDCVYIRSEALPVGVTGPSDLLSIERKPSVVSRIPVNIISGSLGSGKTTAINYLLTQRPAHERWAILVNEYGEIGIDGALMTEKAAKPGVTLKEVAGGCICCSAGFMFQVSLVMLLRQKPDRVLIEPTGLATLSGILETLGSQGVREAVTVNSIITMVDPSRPELAAKSPTFHDQVEAADLIIGNRCDQATKAQLNEFGEWSRGLWPPKKRIAQVEYGAVPYEWLDLVTDRHVEALVSSEPGQHAHSHQVNAHDHSHQKSTDDPMPSWRRKTHITDEAATTGWVVRKEEKFSTKNLASWLQSTMAIDGMTRIKGVVHTQAGWLKFNLVDGMSHTEDHVWDIPTAEPTSYQRDSRIELVSLNPKSVDPERLEGALKASRLMS